MTVSGRSRIKQRIQARRARRPYQTVAIGLYADQSQAIDQAVQELQDAGYVKANRSLIFQTLAKRFLEEIDGLNHEQILEYLLRAHFRRPLARASQRDETSQGERKVSGASPVRSQRRTRSPGKPPQVP